jgi:hypothetical protein
MSNFGNLGTLNPPQPTKINFFKEKKLKISDITTGLVNFKKYFKKYLNYNNLKLKVDTIVMTVDFQFYSMGIEFF